MILTLKVSANNLNTMIERGFTGCPLFDNCKN